MTQGGFQLAGLTLTLGMAIISGTITGIILKTPIIQQIKEEEELFEDDIFWMLPTEASDNKTSTVF